MTAYIWWVRGADHARMAAMSIGSVRAVDTHAAIYVATPEDNPEWAEAYGLRTYLWHVPAVGPTHFSKVAALANVLIRQPGGPVFFMDADTLMTCRIPMPTTVDMVLTFRREVRRPGQPEETRNVGLQQYNGGVWGVRASAVGAEIMVWMRERLRRMASSHQEWWGDQMALYELAGPCPTDEEARTDSVRFPLAGCVPDDRISVLKLPCSTWNYTPMGPDEDVAGRGVLHFKGASRYLMDGYAKQLGVFTP